MLVAAVEFAMNVIDVGVDFVAAAVAVADLLLCLSSMGSDFEHISFFLFAKQKRCVPLHSRKTRYPFQSKH